MPSDISAHYEDIPTAGAGHGGGDGGQSAGGPHPGPDHQGGHPVPGGCLADSQSGSSSSYDAILLRRYKFQNRYNTTLDFKIM